MAKKIRVKKKAIIAILVLLIGLFVYFGYFGKNKGDDGSIDIGKIKEQNSILASNSPAIGNENAYVTLVEFSDYQCPACVSFHNQIMGELKSKYIDTGKVKFVFRDFPLQEIHTFALKSAQASRCAREQGKYWEYNEILFKNSPKLDDGSLKQYAKNLSLDEANFTQCLDSGKYEEAVNSDFNDGVRFGVKGTPTTFMNGHILPGLPDKNQFFKVLEFEIIKIRSSIPK